MSIAEETRRAAQRHPFLLAALRAGVVNYTAAARFLDVGETAAVAAALRRYADDLSPMELGARTVRIRMVTGVGPVDDPDVELLRVGEHRIGREGGEWTAIVAEGPLDPGYGSAILARVATAGIEIEAAAFDRERFILVVSRTAAADVIRLLEETPAPVPGAWPVVD